MATQAGNSVGPHSPQAVGVAFAHQYYRILNESPELVHKFYHDESFLGRPHSDGTFTSVTTTHDINEHFLSTDYKGCLIELENVDTQLSQNGGVFILVTGSLTMADDVKNRFTQSFFLAVQENGGYFVLNDVLRYIPEMPSAETNEAFATFPAEPEIPVEETMDPDLPSADNISGNGEVINPSAETTSVTHDVMKSSVENTSVNNEVMNPSVENISAKEKVINSFGNDNSQVEKNVIKTPEAAPAPPASAQKDVVKKSYASIVMKESTQPAPITKPKPKPTPTVKRAENVEKSVPAPAKPTHATDTAPPNDKNVSDDQGYSVFVKNLPFNATVEMVASEFKKFGAIKPRGIQVIHKQFDGFCFGFIEFEFQESMHAAIEASPLRFGSNLSHVEEKRTPTRVVGGVVTHGNNNGNARGRGGYHGDNFNAGYREGANFRGQGAGFVKNDNYRDGENFRGQGGGVMNNGNYRDGNSVRNEFRNQNEYSGRGRGQQGNGYRQNGDGYRQNQNGDGYRQNQNGDGYRRNQSGDGYGQNRDGYRQNQNGNGYGQNRDGYRQNQNGNGYHQQRPLHNGNGNVRSGRFNGPKQTPVAA
ncbi:putative G3BP-like protein [Brachypodium distachyon]|uniref:NTF2 domain-containing protein n=1 Tax=Brachypodium distachyon TaxID=15368 RepID=I1GSL1_BRADI|nr:putative G3BP-like protein [Brachypodium distachyon]KQK15362.1 hypothetical protein BRADI_1g22160v3 [Brachypodium distachyon]|eukprot:XP_010235890.1 putative G3BP-like protein [Brachypodium distachyon]